MWRPSLSCAALLVLLPAAASARPPLDASQLPTIRALEGKPGHEEYEGRLFTSRMTVNDVTEMTGFTAIGFHSGKPEPFPPLSCKVLDPGEASLARVGKQLWVSGIVAETMASTVFLEPCQISLSSEPYTDPAPWKKHPPKE